MERQLTLVDWIRLISLGLAGSIAILAVLATIFFVGGAFH
jgi:hypothetical protein